MKKESWILKIFLLSFFLAFLFSGITNFIGENSNNIILIIIILIVCLIGVIFDMIGTSVLTCNEASFHAKAARKIRGAKETINLIKNAPKVASICNDVVGDVCGIVSGGLATLLTITISLRFNFSLTLTMMVASAIVSALTIGTKAIFKNYATKNSDEIIFIIGKLLSYFNKQ